MQINYNQEDCVLD